MKLASYKTYVLLILFTIAGSACTGGGGNNSSNSPTINSFLNDFIPHTAVLLDNQTGSLPAGSIVPMACITGGSIIPPDSCSGDHLHGVIAIDGIGSGFSDPAQPICGHGVVGTTLEGFLTHRCPALDDAKLALIVDDLSIFSEAFLELIEPDGSKLLKPLLIPGPSQFFAGLNPIPETIGDTYVSGSLTTKCLRGVNPTTGENEIQHKKINFDYGTSGQVHIKLPFCKPYADNIAGGVNINLSDTGSAAGDFFTRYRSTAAIPLLANTNNMLSYDINKNVKMTSGLVVAYTSPTIKGFALTYDPFANETIDADSSKLQPLIDSLIDDNNYLIDTEYTGIKILGKAQGLLKSYFTLDGSTPSNRNVPTFGTLGSIGGIHKISAEWMATEAITLRTQIARITKFHISPPAVVQYLEPKPPYFADSDFSITDDPGLGLKLDTTYSLGSSGFSSFSGVKIGIRAEFLDTTTTTRHFWAIDNYKADMSETDATFTSSYISNNGGIWPMMMDVTQIQYRFSDDAETTVKHQLYRDRPLSERDDSIGISVNYQF